MDLPRRPPEIRTGSGKSSRCRQDLANHEAIAARKLYWLEQATRVQVAGAWLKLPREPGE